MKYIDIDRKEKGQPFRRGPGRPCDSHYTPRVQLATLVESFLDRKRDHGGSGSTPQLVTLVQTPQLRIPRKGPFPNTSSAPVARVLSHSRCGFTSN